MCHLSKGSRPDVCPVESPYRFGMGDAVERASVSTDSKTTRARVSQQSLVCAVQLKVPPGVPNRLHDRLGFNLLDRHVLVKLDVPKARL